MLAIKLREMEGATLDAITRDLGDQGGDQIERRVAAALGPGLPPPSRLTVSQPGAPRGKVGRVLQDWMQAPGSADAAHPTLCRRIPVGHGVEVLIDARHPLLRSQSEEAAIVDALRTAIAGLLPAETVDDGR